MAAQIVGGALAAGLILVLYPKLLSEQAGEILVPDRISAEP
jgi:hypothetical protein